jgi:hypothetical protein
VAARARLAEKAAEGPKSAASIAQEYAQLEARLKEAADRMRDQLEVRRVWAKTEKTPEARAAFKDRMSSAWSKLDAAMKQLGPDIVLFEEQPVIPENLDSPKTPFLRSVLPDGRGITVTVYLDGSEDWSPPINR